MSQDPRCAPVVLLAKGYYRLVQRRKVHFLDMPTYVLETLVFDATGAPSWRIPPATDSSGMLWLIENLGDLLRETKSGENNGRG